MHACQALQQRTSTRSKQTDTAKKSAMAELVAAKAARAQRSDAQKKCVALPAVCLVHHHQPVTLASKTCTQDRCCPSRGQR